MTSPRSFLRLSTAIIFSCVLFSGIGCMENREADSEKSQKHATIGAILPLTGDASTYGESCQRGMQVASKRLDLSVIYEDGGAEAKTAVNAFNKLVNTNSVDIVLGGMFSAPTLAFAPIAKEREILVLSPTSGSKEVPQTGESIFSLYPAASDEGAYMARYLKKRRSQNTQVGVINAQEQVYADIAKGFMSSLSGEANVQVAFEESIPPNTRDFRDVIIKLKSQTIPDVVFVSGSKEFVSNLIEQAKQLEYDADFLSQSTLYDENLLDDYGQSLEGVTFTGPYFDAESGSKRTEPFISAFRSRFEDKPDVWAAYCYDAVLTTKKMLDTCQNCDAPAMSDTLQSLQFQGMTGPVAFNDFGGAQRSFRIFKVTNGSFKTVNE